jgi:hypothetical protein
MKFVLIIVRAPRALCGDSGLLRRFRSECFGLLA